MRVLFINSVFGVGSTGKICKELYDSFEKEGNKCCIAFGRGDKLKGYNSIKLGNRFDQIIHLLLTRLFDYHGFASKRATRKAIREIEIFNPDIIHLHNIHGYYINIELLFQYIKNNNKKVIWTLHDCWSFTGHCAYYLNKNCTKWKVSCNNCPQIENYPKSFSDFSKRNYFKKKSIFCGVKKMKLITVSEWLNQQVHESFLNKYQTETIYNGINIDVKSLNNRSCMNKLSNQKIILGVANIWDERKGLDDFMKLSKKISDEYIIVLIGLTKRQIKKMPDNVIGFEKTKNNEELMSFYREATVYFNPTKEETFGMTNIEAQMMGLPVVTYNSGGTKETIKTKNSFVINQSVDDFIKMLEKYDFSKMKTAGNSLDEFNNDKFIVQYLNTYKGMVNK